MQSKTLPPHPVTYKIYMYGTAWHFCWGKELVLAHVKPMGTMTHLTFIRFTIVLVDTQLKNKQKWARSEVVPPMLTNRLHSLHHYQHLPCASHLLRMVHPPLEMLMSEISGEWPKVPVVISLQRQTYWVLAYMKRMVGYFLSNRRIWRQARARSRETATFHFERSC